MSKQYDGDEQQMDTPVDRHDDNNDRQNDFDQLQNTPAVVHGTSRWHSHAMYYKPDIASQPAMGRSIATNGRVRSWSGY